MNAKKKNSITFASIRSVQEVHRPFELVKRKVKKELFFKKSIKKHSKYKWKKEDLNSVTKNQIRLECSTQYRI